MRVLLAYDGSPGADNAVALAHSAAWPPASTIRIVAVVELRLISTNRMPGAPVVASQAEADVAALAQEDIQGAVDRLASVDRRVEGAVLRGRPASVLVDEANRFNADLVIGGSRGHGPIASLLLGSVSAEVVDRAPCPMLIARTATISNVVVAADGSEPATAAASLVASWPMFTRVPISVVSVAEVVEPWHTGIAPTMVRQVAAAHARDVAEARAEHSRIAEATVSDLRAAGREASAEVRTGDAASEIIASAEAAGADLVVMGSRGKTGLARMILGSVARNVVQGSRASVLIVHGHDRPGTRGRVGRGVP